MARRVRRILSATDYEKLSTRERDAYLRARQARQIMRRGGPKMSKTRAAHEAGTSLRNLDRYFPDGFEKQGGRWRVNEGAVEWAEFTLPTEAGIRSFVLTGDDLELARRYRDAFAAWYLSNGQSTRQLYDLEGVSVQGYTLESDPARLAEMLDRDELDPRTIGSGTGRR